jgi:hypothetical protein
VIRINENEVQRFILVVSSSQDTLQMNWVHHMNQISSPHIPLEDSSGIVVPGVHAVEADLLPSLLELPRHVGGGPPPARTYLDEMEPILGLPDHLVVDVGKVEPTGDVAPKYGVL